MDPEILRRKAAANGNGLANGHGAASVLAAALKAGAAQTNDGLIANGTTGVPAVNGANKIVASVAA